jgi:hypothetical protein
VVHRVGGGKEAHPRPERNGEAAAEYERAPRRRTVPELSPNHGELVQRGVVSIACPMWNSSLAFL